MDAIVLIGIAGALLLWAPCIVFRETGTLPCVAGFDLFSILQNFVIVPAALIGRFGVVPGVLAAAGVLVLGPVLIRVTVGVPLVQLFEGREPVALALFTTMFWINVGLAIAGWLVR